MKKKKKVDISKNFFKKIAFLQNNKLLEQLDLKYIGIFDNELESKIKKYGKNKLVIKKKQWWKMFLKELFNPFTSLLWFIVIFEFIDYGIYKIFTNLLSGFIVFGMIILSFVISVFQEVKSDKKYNEIIKLIKKESNVIRNVKIKDIEKIDYSLLIKNKVSINSEDIVIGDIVHLSSGDMIPANLKIIFSHELEVNESSLTGESLPVKKSYEVIKKENLNDYSFNNICHPGSNVVSGFGLGVVIANVKTSLLSKIINKKNKIKNTKSFEYSMNKVTKVIIFLVLITCIVGFLCFTLKNQLLGINNLNKNNFWIQGIILVISMSVGLIPESLPLLLTYNLLKCSRKMQNKNILIKSLDSVQTIGAVDILCTDKTGTLTNNELSLEKFYNTNFNLENNKKIFNYSYINAYFQTSLTNNIIDNAILQYKNNENNDNLILNYEKIHEVPFKFNERILTLICKNKKTNKKILISKGATEEIIKNCNYYLKDGKLKKINEVFKIYIYQKIHELNKKNFRIIALATKKIPNTFSYNETKNLKGWILNGFLSFLDLPKKEAEKTIEIINSYNVDVKIISGDSKNVTKHICQKIGFKINKIIEGYQIEQIKKEDLYKNFIECNVFVKISPEQKSEIVKVLQNNKKHQVAFMGDGINDAIALKQSDVSISVENASSVAKEASDFIILNKNLKIIENGIVEGKNVFGNIIRYIKIILANKLALLIIFLTSILWLKFPLMTPFEILFLDFSFDIAHSFTVFDKANPNFKKKRWTWDLKDWYKFSLYNAIIIALIIFINFAIIGYGILGIQNITYNNLESTTSKTIISEFQCSVFIQIAIIYLLSFFILRTEKFSLINNSKIIKMFLPFLIILIFLLLIPLIPGLNSLFKMKYLSIFYLINFILGILYIALAEISKFIYIKIFKIWI